MFTKSLSKNINKIFKMVDKNVVVVYVAIVFIAGLYVCMRYNKYNITEGFTDKSCPNILLQEGNFIYLYNSKRAQVPGVNPIRFNNLDEYKQFVHWQRSQGIRCPVLNLQRIEDAQGNTSYKVRPSVFDQQGGLPPSLANATLETKQKETKLSDASRDNPKFNQNDYAGVDTHNQYIGLETPLDKMFNEKEEELNSDNAMDTNWGGVQYTVDGKEKPSGFPNATINAKVLFFMFNVFSELCQQKPHRIMRNSCPEVGSGPSMSQ